MAEDRLTASFSATTQATADEHRYPKLRLPSQTTIPKQLSDSDNITHALGEDGMK